MPTTYEQRRKNESLDAKALERLQLKRFNALLKAILPQNRLYAQKLAPHLDIDAVATDKRPVKSLAELASLPFTFKEELVDPSTPSDPAVNATFPRQQYVRFHRTSGTHGRPLAVLDTAADWEWWIDCWQYVYDAAGVDPGDALFMAFSFGPFVGFWSAFDAAARRGCLVVPAGGMNTRSRLDLLAASRATVVLCTPSYALHLAEVAANEGIDLGALPVKRLIVAGEPGGSIPETRARLEAAWQAAVFDHSGATEIGPWGYGDAAGSGLWINEAEFIAEFLSVETGRPAGEGELSEIVLTTLGRVGSPVIRYRTGDLARPSWRHRGENRFVFLDGGVLGRTDDMLVVRGVNIFPSSIDQIVRGFPEIIEYRVVVRKAVEMDQLVVEIEDRLENPARVAAELELRLGLKVEARLAPIGSLPRFEGKGKRVSDERGTP